MTYIGKENLLDRKQDLTRFRSYTVAINQQLINTNQNRNAEYIKHLRNMIDILSPLYLNSKLHNKTTLKKCFMVDPRQFSPTSYEIMGSQFAENVHSNVLVYLFQQNTIKKTLLKNILLNIIEKDKNDKAVDSIIKVIEKTEFQSRREYRLGDGRIDILIIGMKFVIVIENKIKSRIHLHNGLPQTEYYRREIQNKYPNHNIVFIILDYKGTEMSPGYHTINYIAMEKALKDTLSSIENVSSTQFQNIFQEYLYLINRLIRGVAYINIGEVETLDSLTLINNMVMESKKWI